MCVSMLVPRRVWEWAAFPFDLKKPAPIVLFLPCRFNQAKQGYYGSPLFAATGELVVHSLPRDPAGDVSAWAPFCGPRRMTGATLHCSGMWAVSQNRAFYVPFKYQLILGSAMFGSSP